MFQVLDECPCCRVESAVAALFDPAHVCCLLGVAANSRCRLCGRATRGRVTPPCAPPGDAEKRLHDDRCPSCGDRMAEHERLDARCGRCGIVAREEETRPGNEFEAPADLERALGRWAHEEGHDSTEEFVASSFLDGDTETVYRRIQAGERVETNFDVLAFLFPELAVASAIPAEPRQETEPTTGAPRSDAPTVQGDVQPQSCRPADDPSDGSGSEPAGSLPIPDTSLQTTRPDDAFRDELWAPMLPLVSVMVADGRVHPAEEAFIQRFLAANQCPPVPAQHVRVHRPEVVPMPPDPRTRERMLEAMVHLVHVDRLRDGTEFRVVEEYARAWGVAPARTAHWDQLYRTRYATGLRRLWLILQSTFTKD